MTLILPWPPTVNTYWRSFQVRGALRVLISRKGRAYTAAVGAECLAQRAPRYLNTRLAVDITACPPDARTRDLDNLLKPLLDALVKAGVMLDDGQVDEIHIRRGPIVAAGRIELTLSPTNGAAR